MAYICTQLQQAVPAHFFIHMDSAQCSGHTWQIQVLLSRTFWNFFLNFQIYDPQLAEFMNVKPVDIK